ncbi:MAG TPA: tRNA (adenosine(37)-N6)-threonylcarbamoyltransferase complex transferase subunit TsaD [Planctomycetota bacterium]|nr:tRNA (adenosine(37)-N6)-threonylcarbamoyltransferase complex transferase subunit TsaD [Planctomycetota bacterium]
MSSDLILGIESSCDETAAAVVAGGRRVLSSVVESQATQHARYGGVVPEVAGRSHSRAILPVIEEALEAAGVGFEALAGVAVTTRPGLIGSLLVGLSAAKALAWSRGLPLIDVDHIEAHVYSAAMEYPPERGEPWPCVALVVSGGHTSLYRAESAIELELLASTLDDAAGEAFDKVAHLLGLPYPGGPSVSRLAAGGDPGRIAFPRYRPRPRPGEPPPRFPPFSFSGLKTAVLYHLRGQDALAPTPAPEAIADRADVAASFQEAVVDSLVAPCLSAARELGLERVLVVGGVACNARLRERMAAAATEAGLESWFPSPAYCTDNAAMIAGLGWQHLAAGRTADLACDASPRSAGRALAAEAIARTRRARSPGARGR